MWARELTAVRYSIPIRACRTPVRSLFFSDLHGASFGEGNRQLLELALAQRADFAALPGDLISRDSPPETVERVCKLLAALAGAMPVYLSLGNHEQDYLAHNGPGLQTALAQTGAAPARPMPMRRLAEMRPTLPRTAENYRRTLLDLAAASEEVFQ